MFEELLRNPLLKKALSAGEERLGKVVAAVLSNERIMAHVQGAVSTALEAKAAVEKGMRSALQAANLPSRDDVAELQKRMAELEALIDGLAARIDQESEPGAAPPEAAGTAPKDPPGAP